MQPERAVSEPVQLTLQAAAQIRGLIIEGVLLPGQKIRQVDLADRIGVSRSPLREALRTLESEGAVTYELNRGYVVARLTPADLAEIYRMRELLESELLRSIVKPDKATLDMLGQYNNEMIAAVRRGDIAGVLRANREFHFAIFGLSPMSQYKREIQRLWQLSEGYLIWWWQLPDVTTRINQEHKQIIRALRKFDREALVELCDSHRFGGHEAVGIPLGRPD
ncbi:GntR family transcriptional regulator [Streptomyces sp. NPDC056975]|uniref:GntR family transcriptional regulator n=1 Tax=Streptomyces sp. NPDC056975 TaxID=3345985 RepID=UPI0036373022